MCYRVCSDLADYDYKQCEEKAERNVVLIQTTKRLIMTTVRKWLERQMFI